jgi:hypothetical protein
MKISRTQRTRRQTYPAKKRKNLLENGIRCYMEYVSKSDLAHCLMSPLRCYSWNNNVVLSRCFCRHILWSHKKAFLECIGDLAARKCAEEQHLDPATGLAVPKPNRRAKDFIIKFARTVLRERKEREYCEDVPGRMCVLHSSGAGAPLGRSHLSSWISSLTLIPALWSLINVRGGGVIVSSKSWSWRWLRLIFVSNWKL